MRTCRTSVASCRSQVSNLSAEAGGEQTERLYVLTQDGEIVGWALGNDEALAAQADEQRERPDEKAFGPLVRAQAGEFSERVLQVRKLSHDDSVFPSPDDLPARAFLTQSTGGV